MTDAIATLTAFFKRFPGIGPRQASRFVYFLLKQDRQTLEYFSSLVLSLKKDVKQCPECFRFFAIGHSNICSECSDTERTSETLLVVEKDSDFENARHLNDFSGKFFILGGNVPILENEPHKRIRLNQLKERIDRDKEKLSEVILALSATREGDYTTKLIKEEFAELATFNDIRFTSLGRGLSTGIEIEYTDPDTMQAALRNRA